MRMTSMVAGLAIVLAACGGENKSASDQPATADQPAADQQAAPSQPGAAGNAPAAAGATHDVNMVLEGSSYKYVPDQLTIKPNDVVRYHNKSGGPHNVAFWADSIPVGRRISDYGPRSHGPAIEQAGRGAERNHRSEVQQRTGRRVQVLLHPAPGAWHEGEADGEAVTA